MLTPRHRNAVLLVATAAGLTALWLLLVAVPLLIDRHRDDALAVAVGLLFAVPAGCAWGARRLCALLDPMDSSDE